MAVTLGMKVQEYCKTAVTSQTMIVCVVIAKKITFRSLILDSKMPKEKK